MAGGSVKTVLGFDFGLKRIGVAVGNTGLRQAQPLLRGKAFAQFGCQAPRLRTEDQPVTGREDRVVHGAGAPRGEREHAPGRRSLGGEQGVPVGMAAHLGIFVVVESGAAQEAVGHREAQGLDQVQRAAGVGGQPDHVAGVGWDFGFDEDDVEHAR